MKHIFVLPAALAALFLFACASSKQPSEADLFKPQIDLVQVIGPADLGYPRGQIDLKYELHVSNPSNEAITLKRFEISSVGSGSYQLRRESFPFNAQLPPGQTGSVDIWAHGYARGGTFGSNGSNEPVTVRGIAYFDAPSGPFRKIITRDISQFQNRN